MPHAVPSAPPRARLRRVALDGPADGLDAALHLRGDERPVALHGDWLGGGTVLASAPVRVLAAGEDPLGAVDDLPEVADAVPGAIGGGWLGWLGFGAGARVERLVAPPPRPVALPESALGLYDHVVRQDPEGRWWFEALELPGREAALAARVELWRARLAGPPPAAGAVPDAALRAVGAGTAGHAAAVAVCRERIAAGEVFQANLCLRLEAPWDGDPLDLWVRAARELRPGYAAFCAGPWGAVASLSPERFLRREDREVVADPIKGTAPAGTDPAVLAASAKDRAENVMIADLLRNDLGRVCAFGSVTVDALAEVRPGPGVLHLVSTVRGTLRDAVGDGELLRATFPPGSVTGAPKVRALRVIAELEGTAREAYCGAIGIASPLAGLELSVAIRTFEAAGGRLWLGAGGGVTFGSSPEGEVREALAKAGPVARAAGLRVVAEPAAAAGPVDGLPWALDAGRERPDPARGLLETLRVTGGRAPLAAAHLARLAASAAALGLAVPDDLAARVAAAAAAVGDGALRVVLDASGARVAPRPLPPATAPTVLRPWVLPGGLGEHKWADRRLVDALGADGTTPLLVDLDGAVLEAGYAAVLLRRDGVLLGPPVDGRILPSTTRARHDVRPARLTLADLTGGEVLLASALRGLHPARLATRA